MKRKDMAIRIVEEAGHHSAVTGMRFSFQPECPLGDILSVAYVDTSSSRALASKDKGHNKFLESIMVWMDIQAPLYFWKEFDTYRVGITKQSKSTMHTIMKGCIPDSGFVPEVHIGTIDMLNDLIEQGDFTAVIANLPDGYLQTRRVCISYKGIRSIMLQRKNHKLKEWAVFCEYMLQNLRYPRLLGGDVR